VETAVFRFFLPTLAGNVFGGTILFSVLSYAQVREEIYADTSES
jgi:formate/nitrite transporter FocA (FNT family)